MSHARARPCLDDAYNLRELRGQAGDELERLAGADDRDRARQELLKYIEQCRLREGSNPKYPRTLQGFRARDCARTMEALITPASEEHTGFSVLQALYDLARGKPRPDLSSGFYAEMIHLFRGMQAKAVEREFDDFRMSDELEGREAALLRSRQLDELWSSAEAVMARYKHGLLDEVRQRRARRRREILDRMGGDEARWNDHRWQFANVVKRLDQLERLVTLSDAEREAIGACRAGGVPFGVTPFYLSLMDDNREDCRAVRAQVFPPLSYIQSLAAGRGSSCELDFMGESDTSPIDLVTRRYATVAILKPFNACPQICVYCQRNWEIDDAMFPGALASNEQIAAAIGYFAEHPALHDVLITGGDPLALDDAKLKWILDRLAAIPSIERIRIGSRTPVTAPMRFTPELVRLLASYRAPGRREVCLVTHVQHPYEINDEMVQAVDRLRCAGISVYNQLVYTFHVSRRFEATLLRRLLRKVGIDPYYTFNAKGKEETIDYRVPLARLLQEQKEESRLLPGLGRTDEAVFNVPRLGKNHLRAMQHRDLISIRADGSRIYVFHPWEKSIAKQQTYDSADVPILDYLKRLAQIGENPQNYDSIWYYF